MLCMENEINVWKDLKERFYQGDQIHVSELKLEIDIFKQVSKIVSEFYSTLKVLWKNWIFTYQSLNILVELVVHVKLWDKQEKIINYCMISNFLRV